MYQIITLYTLNVCNVKYKSYLKEKRVINGPAIMY